MAAPLSSPGAAGYDPRALGAKCDRCPFSGDRSDSALPAINLPVPALFSPNPIAIIVGESPGSVEAYKGVPFCGKTGRRLTAELEVAGLPRRRLHILQRLACDPGRRKSVKLLRQAADCCAPRFVKDLERAQSGAAGVLPVLLLGKWAPDGVLSIYETKLARGMIVEGAAMAGAGAMVLPHPTYAFFHKPAESVIFRAGLQRFKRWTKERALSPWPHVELYPNEAALVALRAMGPNVGWDVETLGVDPLTCPISCIGLSDGVHTVSMPWSSYTNKHGYVLGLRDYGELGRTCEAEIKDVLESNRTLITQNGNYDVGAMRKTGINARNDVDIMHAYSILWPELPKNLEAIGVHVLPELRGRWKSMFRRGDDSDGKADDVYVESREEALREYNGRDAWVTVRAWLELQKGLG